MVVQTNKNIKKCNILGVNIAATNYKEVIEFICQNIKSVSGNYICFSNVHTTIMSIEDEYYKRVQNSSLFSLPDGNPLANTAKRRGYATTSRITARRLYGIDF